MGVIVVLGREYDIDPGQLRAIADRADDLAAELTGLDPAVLTPVTLSRSPGFIAEHLRSVAKLIERKQSGEPGLADIFETMPPDDRRKAFAEMNRAERRRAVAEIGLGRP
jgi:hypothetical protein